MWINKLYFHQSSPTQYQQFRFDSVYKKVGSRVILDNIGLALNKKECIGLIGPNGSGKSTLFKILSGFIHADKGNVYLDDKRITYLPAYKRSLMGLGYLPQETSLFYHLTVEQNIICALQLRCRNKKVIQQECDELLSLFKLTQKAKAKGYFLSGGERKRVEIARLVACKPQFLLLDEPFAAIDPIAIDTVIENILNIIKHFKIGVMITDHNFVEVFNMTNNIWVMINGSMIVNGSKEVVMDNPLVQKYYLGQRR